MRVAEASGGVESDRAVARRSRVGRPAAGDTRYWWTLGGIVAFGLVLRVAYVLLTKGDFVFSDSDGYHYRAILLADGKGFVLPLQEVLGIGGNPQDAHVPPMWTIVLGGATKLGMRSMLQQQIATAFVGAVAVLMTGIAGRAAFGRSVGLLAAGLMAIYPNAWVYERELISEPLSIAMAATVIWLTYRYLARPSVGAAVAMGIAAGAMALTRAEQVLIFGLLVLPAVITTWAVPPQRRLGLAAASIVAGLAVIAPWAAYNSTRFERPVPLSTGLGAALRSGNCRPTYFNDDLLGWYSIAWAPRRPERGCSILGDEWAADPSVSSDQLRDAAVEFMLDNKSRVPVVVAARIGRTFNVFRPFDQVHREAERGSPVPVVRAGLLAYWALVPCAVVGGIAARRRGVPIYPLVAFFVIVVVAVGMTIGSVRYRAPAEPSLVILASLGILSLWSRLRRRGNGPEEPPVPADDTAAAAT